MKKEIAPVVFVHTGKPSYLKHTIRMAEKSCSRVVLLGDDANKKVAKEWISQELLLGSGYEAFEKAYVHMSSLTYEFELACFRRYFALLGFMKDEGLEAAVMVDSDLCTFTDLSTFDFGDADVAVSYDPDEADNGWSVCPHCLYITGEALEDFIAFLLTTYTGNLSLLEDRWTEYQKKNQPGGICDMTLLYLWCRKTRYKVVNHFEDRWDGIFDHTLMTSNGGIIKLNSIDCGLTVKAMDIVDDKICFVTEEGKRRPAYIIHAQGAMKAAIPLIAKGKVKDADMVRMGQILRIKYYLKSKLQRRK